MPERADEPPFNTGRSIVCPDCGERIEWMRPPTLTMMLDGLSFHQRTRHETWGPDSPGYDEMGQ